MTEDIKERLVKAAEKLIKSGKKQTELTVREIAAEAGTSPGLVNYHFRSKDELLAKAAERMWEEFNPRWNEVSSVPLGTEELKTLLKDIGDAVDRVSVGTELKIRHELLDGEMDTAVFLASILRKILPPEVPESEIRTAAYAIVAPLQLAFLRRSYLSRWIGQDFARKENRDALFDFVIDRILGPYRGLPDRA